jgi:glycosyltransferase involved in cell wall biosynthesis
MKGGGSHMKMVSVYLITYKHEQFIGQSIESIVNQKVNFDFELVIGEDMSPDNTRAICEDYAARYPHIINLLPSDKRYGVLANDLRIHAQCNGKYIAFCEGDDYWLDPYKLQKQFDFLEVNPDFTLCFSDVQIIDEIGNCFENKYPRKGGDVYTIEDIIQTERNIMPTPTLFFRNILPRPLPPVYTNINSGDICVQLLLADKGKVKYFAENMAVYRNHSGGISKSPEYIKTGDSQLFRLYSEINEYFDFRYNTLIRKRLLDMSKVKLIYHASGLKGMAKFKHYLKQFPDYLKYSDKINFKEALYYHMVLFMPWALKLFKK